MLRMKHEKIIKKQKKDLARIATVTLWSQMTFLFCFQTWTYVNKRLGTEPAANSENNNTFVKWWIHQFHSLKDNHKSDIMILLFTAVENELFHIFEPSNNKSSHKIH